MTHWKNARKWKKVWLNNSPEGFEIFLDDNRLLTPKNEIVVLKTKKLALKVLKEWEKQEKFVEPSTMPVTRLVNSAIDTVKVDHQLIVEHLLSYGETDLICYRARNPAELVELQNANWNPVLEWARKDLKIGLKCVYGLCYETQCLQAIKTIRERINEFDCFTLVAFSELVTISGSMLLGLATYYNFLEHEEAWQKSVLDEVWQGSKWGYDEESKLAREKKLKDFKFAYEFLTLLK